MHEILTTSDPDTLIARIRTELGDIDRSARPTRGERPAEPPVYSGDALGQLFETLHRERTESSECARRWTDASLTTVRDMHTAYQAVIGAQRQLLAGLQNALEQRAASDPQMQHPVAYGLERQLVHQDLRAESAAFAVRALDRELSGAEGISIPLHSADAALDASDAASLGTRWIALERQTLAHARAQAIKHFDDVVYAPDRPEKPGLPSVQRQHEDEIKKQGFLSVALVAQLGLMSREIAAEPNTDLVKQAFVYAALYTHLVSEYPAGQHNPISRHLLVNPDDVLAKAMPLTDGDRYLKQRADSATGVLTRLARMQAELCSAAHGLAHDNKAGELEPKPQGVDSGQALGRIYEDRPLYGFAQFIHDAGNGWPPGCDAGWLGVFLVDMYVLAERALPTELNAATHEAPPLNFGRFSDQLTLVAQGMDAPLKVFRQPAPPPSASGYNPMAGEFFDLVQHFGSFGGYGSNLTMSQFVQNFVGNDAGHLLNTPPQWMLQDAGPHARSG